jgi:hypothetical protein
MSDLKTFLKRIRRVIWSPDLILAALIALTTAILCPSVISISMAKDFYGVGISVLSIVFSIFFAALAIVMSAGDNEFITFLHKEGAYTEIVWNFRFAVMILFTSLIVTLAEYVYAGFRFSHKAEWHSKWFLVIFFFCFSYSLLAVCLAILDAIKYSSNRVKFLNSKMH